MTACFPRNLVYVAVLALATASVAAAQTTPTTPPEKGSTATAPGPGSTGMDKGAGTGATAKAGKPSASVASGDIRFMEKAMQGNLAEIDLGKLAESKAASADVKAYGKKLVDDHSKANDKLKQLASSKGVTPPAELSAAQKRDHDRLAKLSGNAFMKHMVDDHQDDVRSYKSTAKSAKDAELRSFASSSLPTLQEHLALAKQTEAAVKRAPRDTKAAATAPKDAMAGAGPTGTAKSTATAGKDTAATTGTAGPGTGMPASTEQAGTSAPQPPGGPADTKKAAPQK